VHLRGGKGRPVVLRWSRPSGGLPHPKCLGLVLKSQQVKNAVIVPVGGQGGFCAPAPALGGNRDEISAEEAIALLPPVHQGLLDLTDNSCTRASGFSAGPRSVRHDEG